MSSLDHQNASLKALRFAIISQSVLQALQDALCSALLCSGVPGLLRDDSRHVMGEKRTGRGGKPD